MYELIAQGGANRLYRRENGSVIRVSKHDIDPNTVAEYWNKWRAVFGSYMGEMAVATDAHFGRVLQVTEVGGEPSKHVIGQFKPKWLSQSPAAPADALSCRTCAIKTMRHQELTWCSLDLAHKERLLHLARSIGVGPHFTAPFIRALETSDLIEKLCEWQRKSDLCDAMSLRDCTIMVEYDDAEAQARLWLVDLDPKNKFAKWQRLEEELQPYYRMRSSVCRLSRDL